MPPAGKRVMDRISAQKFRAFLRQKQRKQPKTAFAGDGLLVDVKKETRSKYGNRRCEYDGLKFASELERDRYIFLKGCQMRGEITNLRVQVRYELFPDEYEDVVVHLKTKDKTVKRRTYIGVFYTADFVYDKVGKEVVEDTKGSLKVVSRDFELRKKMLHYLKGIDLKVVTKATEAV